MYRVKDEINEEILAHSSNATEGILCAFLTSLACRLVSSGFAPCATGSVTVVDGAECSPCRLILLMPCFGTRRSAVVQLAHRRCLMYAGGGALCARDAGGYAPCAAPYAEGYGG